MTAELSHTQCVLEENTMGDGKVAGWDCPAQAKSRTGKWAWIGQIILGTALMELSIPAQGRAPAQGTATGCRKDGLQASRTKL